MKTSLSAKINNSKEAKRFTYKIIKKLQSLEKHGRCVKLYTKKIEGCSDASITVCAREVKDYLEKGLECDNTLRTSHLALSKELGSFVDIISKYSINHKKLPKGRTLRVLRKHKKLFKYRQVDKIKTVETTPDHWYNAIVNYLHVWNNKV